MGKFWLAVQSRAARHLNTNTIYKISTKMWCSNKISRQKTCNIKLSTQWNSENSAPV